MSVIKGDFLGFTFDGINSSELGVFRVSDGSRYSENLLPTIQDKTTQVPGADGTYFHGSYYTQKPFNLSVAFDDMTEEQLRRLKRVFGDKKIHELIFDEMPFKIYKVKATGTPNLKYVCFDKEVREGLLEGEEVDYYSSKEDLYNIHSCRTTERRYKGEGQLNFIAYNPYAKSRFKYSTDYTFKNIPEWNFLNVQSSDDVGDNSHEWIAASRMKKEGHKEKTNSGTFTLDKYEYVEDEEAGALLLYNAGDVDTPINIIIKGFSGDKITVYGELMDKSFTISKIELNDKETGFRINTRLHLIEGLIGDKPSGFIYNKNITEGDFFKLPPMDKPTLYWITGASDVEVEYSYLYY